LAAAEGKSVTADNLALYAARARGSLYYDQIHSRARQSITSQIDKRRGQVLSRPTGTNGKPASPDQAARQFVSQFMQTRGAADADDDFGL
jgi:hypothetical protein